MLDAAAQQYDRSDARPGRARTSPRCSTRGTSSPPAPLPAARRRRSSRAWPRRARRRRRSCTSTAHVRRPRRFRAAETALVAPRGRTSRRSPMTGDSIQLPTDVGVVNVGLPLFADAVAGAGSHRRCRWTGGSPPAAIWRPRPRCVGSSGRAQRTGGRGQRRGGAPAGHRRADAGRRPAGARRSSPRWTERRRCCTPVRRCQLARRLRPAAPVDARGGAWPRAGPAPSAEADALLASGEVALSPGP